MDPGFYQVLIHALTTALGTMAAVCLLILLRRLLKRLGWPHPVDPTEGVETGLQDAEPTARAATNGTVNVQYHDSTGVVVDPGPLVRVTMHNGRSGPFVLHGGVFRNCDATQIKVGSTVTLSVQDGLVREDVPVQLDYPKQLLFVQSRYSLVELVRLINRNTERRVAAS